MQNARDFIVKSTERLVSHHARRLLVPVALQPVLLQLQKEFPDVLVLAYCGDKNLIGDAPRVSLPTSAVAGC